MSKPLTSQEEDLNFPLLRLEAVGREYAAGEGVVAALKNITLDIYAGDYLAIVGASGSGKSTLMNILGCLDRPTAGAYYVAGRDTASLPSDALAILRRERFGFIFQRYHLLSDVTALGNVEIPAIYAGYARTVRKRRACDLLTRLHLFDRMHHTPTQLSGGQQQRVSIARALMNGGEVLLADEPTGALDSQSGEDVLNLLGELHARGHTIIVVTHNSAVARRAERTIELRDGAIVSDRRQPRDAQYRAQFLSDRPVPTKDYWQALRDRFREASRMALFAVRAHRLRTFLTMLGIIIGIAAVVSVVALGNGTREKILQSINALGTNTLDIYPGTGPGDPRASRIQTLRATDVLALEAQNYVDSVTPNVSTASMVRAGNATATAQVYGVGDQFFRVKGMVLLEGAFFDAAAIDRLDPSVVIDEAGRAQLFGDSLDSPVGKIILLGKVPVRVTAITKRPSSISSGSLSIWMPYSALLVRLLGRSYVSSITVRVSDYTPMSVAEQAITRQLFLQHGRKDFFIQNTAQIRNTIEAATKTMTWLVGSIAAISLIVGGIGVMNIMLVSVAERTQEIGVRMAVGARRSDIRQHFLIETVLVCLSGGTFGVLGALGLGWLSQYVGNENFPMVFSTKSVVVAVLSSTMIGIIFGYLPANNAACLDPIQALARE